MTCGFAVNANIRGGIRIFKTGDGRWIQGAFAWASQLLQRLRRTRVAGGGGTPVPAFGLPQVALLVEQEPRDILGLVVAGVGGHFQTPLGDPELIGLGGGKPDRQDASAYVFISRCSQTMDGTGRASDRSGPLGELHIVTVQVSDTVQILVEHGEVPA
jgi:hypothetical protein